jgi:hypothetical protein
MRMMTLSDAAIRNIKPAAKPFKRGDDHGLYLLVTHQGPDFGDTII